PVRTIARACPGAPAVVAGMSAGRYVLGLVALIAICGSLGVAAVAVRRRYLPDWTGAPARLAEAVTALALIIGVLEALGAVGLFRLVPIVVACLVLGGWGRARLPYVRGRDAGPSQGLAIALVAGAAVIAE